MGLAREAMDCRNNPSESLEQLGRALADAPPRPYSAMLELTARCNNRCRHCYIVHSVPAQGPDDDLPFEFWDELMDVLVGEECLWISFTGGEPLLHPDFAKIYVAAKEKGLLPSVLTNACLVTDEIADLFVEYPVRGITVSIYGMTRETYEAVTQRPGSYDAALAGIGRLLERNLPVQLQTMVLRSNVHELDQMRAYAAERGGRLHYDVAVSPAIDGSLAPCEERLEPEAAVCIEMADEQRREGWRQAWLARSELQTNRLYICEAGQRSVFVTYDARLTGCVADRGLALPLDRNCLLASFREVYYNSLPKVYGQLAPAARCVRCEARVVCPACPAWRRVEAGDATAAVPYGCRPASLRARALAATGSEPRRAPA